MTIENQTENTANESGISETSQTQAAEVEQPETAQRRGRGRPKKAEAETTTQKETAPGATNTARTRKTKGAKVDVSALAKNLVGIHQLAFVMTGQQIPEVVISDQEGAALATGICAVCDEYDLSIDGKTGAFLQLFGAAAMVYVPRYLQYRARMAKMRPVDVEVNEVQQ